MQTGGARGVANGGDVIGFLKGERGRAHTRENTRSERARASKKRRERGGVPAARAGECSSCPQPREWPSTQSPYPSLRTASSQPLCKTVHPTRPHTQNEHRGISRRRREGYALDIAHFDDEFERAGFGRHFLLAVGTVITELQIAVEQRFGFQQKRDFVVLHHHSGDVGCRDKPQVHTHTHTQT